MARSVDLLGFPYSSLVMVWRTQTEVKSYYLLYFFLVLFASSLVFPMCSGVEYLV